MEVSGRRGEAWDGEWVDGGGRSERVFILVCCTDGDDGVDDDDGDDACGRRVRKRWTDRHRESRGLNFFRVPWRVGSGESQFAGRDAVIGSMRRVEG